MKNTIRNKLNSNRGASMMLALALFLVCVMVSSIIIATAASGTSRNHLRTERQQDYLAVSSASEMIAKDLEEVGQFVTVYEKKVYGCLDFQNIVAEYYYGERITGYEYQEGQIADSMDAVMVDEHHSNVLNIFMDEEHTTVDGLFKELIIRAAQSVYKNNVAYEEKVYISMAEADERLPEVVVNFVMDRDYNMTFEITTAGSEYAMVISLVANVVETESSIEPEDKSFFCEHLIYYKEKQEDDSYADASTIEKIYGSYELRNTTITWDTPIITKGVGVE